MSSPRLLMSMLLPLFGAVAAAPTATADPRARSCERLLGQEPRLHDPQHLLDRSLDSLRLRDWLCRTGFESRDELTRTASALDLPDAGLGTLLGYLLPDEPQAFRAALSGFCRNGYQAQTSPTVRAHFERLAAANMGAAYAVCLDRRTSTPGTPQAYAYVVPDDGTLSRFQLRVRGSASRPRLIDGDGASCAAAEPLGANDYAFKCGKSPWREATIELDAAGGTQRLLVPGATTLRQYRMAVDQLILADRLDALEHALGIPGAEQEAEATRNGEAALACPSGSYVYALSTGQDGPRPRCQRLPPNWP